MKQKPHLLWTGAALAGTALAGVAGTDVHSSWYRSLTKATLAAARMGLRARLDDPVPARCRGLGSHPGQDRRSG